MSTPKKLFLSTLELLLEWTLLEISQVEGPVRSFQFFLRVLTDIIFP
jgi:hypothetical protein